MYAAHFGLREPPFALTPDPAYIYLSPQHREALAHLLYGAEEYGGFVQLTGEVGTGKTTLVRALLEQGLAQVDIALCLNPRLTVEELLATVCDELGVAYPQQSSSLKAWVDALNQHLLGVHAAGRRTVLVIDEAQNLSREVLEQIRLLTNLETTKRKLLRIILVGQPELRTLLARPDLRQLAQRITARYHLPSLNARDTAAYISHRLRVAGATEALFSRWAQRAIYRYSGGVPRLINIICDRALLGAYGQGRKQVDARIVRQAARETLPHSPAGLQRAISPMRVAILSSLLGLMVIAAAIWLPDSDTVPLAFWNWNGAPLARAERTTVLAVTREVAPTTAARGDPLNRPVVPEFADLLPKASVEQANQRLLALWGLSPVLEPGKAFCQQVKAYALRCLSGQGDWEALRRFDHPAVLPLNQPGITAAVVLRALTAEQATVELAGQTLDVPLARLQPLWTGDYWLLWRPQIEPTAIGPGSSGAAVRWLRQQLARAAGQPVPKAPAQRFDARLGERVRRFQQARGLLADGVADERTVLLLHLPVLPPDTPRLGKPTPAR